jgi:hypothetical protein
MLIHRSAATKVRVENAAERIAATVEPISASIARQVQNQVRLRNLSTAALKICTAGASTLNHVRQRDRAQHRILDLRGIAFLELAHHAVASTIAECVDFAGSFRMAMTHLNAEAITAAAKVVLGANRKLASRCVDSLLEAAINGPYYGILEAIVDSQLPVPSFYLTQKLQVWAGDEPELVAARERARDMLPHMLDAARIRRALVKGRSNTTAKRGVRAHAGL